jgi:hypothetical protein
MFFHTSIVLDAHLLHLFDFLECWFRSLLIGPLESDILGP